MSKTLLLFSLDGNRLFARKEGTEKVIAFSPFDERGITTHGAGASQPLANNSTPGRMAENRRAEIHLGY